jgi:hypothetical protein
VDNVEIENGNTETKNANASETEKDSTKDQTEDKENKTKEESDRTDIQDKKTDVVREKDDKENDSKETKLSTKEKFFRSLSFAKKETTSSTKTTGTKESDKTNTAETEADSDKNMDNSETKTSKGDDETKEIGNDKESEPKIKKSTKDKLMQSFRCNKKTKAVKNKTAKIDNSENNELTKADVKKEESERALEASNDTKAKVSDSNENKLSNKEKFMRSLSFAKKSEKSNKEETSEHKNNEPEESNLAQDCNKGTDCEIDGTKLDAEPNNDPAIHKEDSKEDDIPESSGEVTDNTTVTLDEDTPRKTKRTAKDKLMGSFRFLKKKSDKESSDKSDVEGTYKLEVETKTETPPAGADQASRVEEEEIKAEEPKIPIQVEVKPEGEIETESEIKLKTEAVSDDKPVSENEPAIENKLQPGTANTSEMQYDDHKTPLVNPEMITKEKVVIEKLEPISEEAESKVEPEVMEKTE